MSLKPQYIRSMFNDIADRYDMTNTVMSLGMNRRWRMAAARLAAITPGGKVIDLCCGTGALSFKLSGLGQSEVVGIDYSDKMIAEAKEKLQRHQDHATTFITKDLYDNGYPDNYFDAATIAWGLRNTDDCQRTVREMARLVRPGGRVVMLEMGKINNRLLNDIYWKTFGLAIPLVGYFFTKNLAAYKYFFESSKFFLNQNEMILLMQKSGLKNIGCKNFLWGAVTIIYGDK